MAVNPHRQKRVLLFIAQFRYGQLETTEIQSIKIRLYRKTT